MTDTQHTQQKEAVQADLNSVLVCDGVSVGSVEIATTEPFVAHDDGSWSGPNGQVTYTPSKEVQAAIAMWKAAQTPVSPPPPPPPSDPTPPVSPPASTKPVAAFDIAVDGATVTCTDHSVGGDQYQWLWGDGHSEYDAPGDAVHIYPTAGTYIVKLTVLNAGKIVASASQTVTTTAPAAEFGVTVDGAVVTCTDHSVGGDKYQWLWGDGRSEYDDPGDASHTYPTAGTYTIKLTVMQDGKSVASASQTVTTTVDGASPAAPTPPSSGTTSAPTAPVVSTLPVSDVPPAAPAHGAGAHAVVMTVVDKDHTWVAQALVGDDPTVAATVVRFANADGSGTPHSGLNAWFYADCVEAGATGLDNAYDYINFKSVTVTYDGATVPVPKSSKSDGTFDFWRGCRCPAIRYGKQVGWSADKIDWSLLPSWPRDQQQAPFDDSKMDYSFNGLGCASMPGMGSGGSRPDIGYMPVWDMAFLTAPADATWALVRRAADYAGWWGLVYESDPDTGGIARMDKFAMLSADPHAHGGSWSANAICQYGGSYDGDTLVAPDTSIATGAPGRPDAAHLTGYALLAAMITGTARDRDHASFWSNYPVFAIGSPGVRNGQIVVGAQRRFAWVVRNLFVASYVSADTTYFMDMLAAQLPVALAHMTNPVGALDTECSYPRAAVADGGAVAVAPWMQYYLAIVIDAVSHKLPEWLPFAQFLGKFMANWVNCPLTALASVGSFTVKTSGADGQAQTVMDDFVAQASISLARFGYTDAQIAAVAAATTEQECYEALKAAQAAVLPGTLSANAVENGQCVDGAADFIGYLGAPDAYGALAGAAMACAYNTGIDGADKLLARWQAIPTKPDFSQNAIYNIVPRGS